MFIVYVPVSAASAIFFMGMIVLIYLFHKEKVRYLEAKIQAAEQRGRDKCEHNRMNIEYANDELARQDEKIERQTIEWMRLTEENAKLRAEKMVAQAQLRRLMRRMAAQNGGF
ncbi:Oidioi.mRNA.OKI2018_I69.chr1.g1107.t1.cds [Oikopleura dioica]|uniref:Oidioi.mRNA.OKI2018_I69.chr1.g1107.t1.cds n=1 Tax=Oikopleura dioica TaxID=34765 RepID=A0ABN7SMF6_OIKDI|nr:Oidioi.mRNA.OKI2018_I69.chr1.g1107.t1.cds [Oikopleura dioica]